MGIVSKIKKRWKLRKEIEIEELIKNIDTDAFVSAYPGTVITIASTNRRHWKIVDALNRFNIKYSIMPDGMIKIKVHHKHSNEDEEPDTFNSDGGFEI
jgi:sulfur relay (sulfurtransferase) DsrC/TusE family protein